MAFQERGELGVKDMLTSLISVIVGVALIPILYEYINDANITNPAVSGLVSLIPLFFAIGILLNTVRGVL